MPNVIYGDFYKEGLISILDTMCFHSSWHSLDSNYSMTNEVHRKAMFLEQNIKWMKMVADMCPLLLLIYQRLMIPVAPFTNMD